MEELKNRQYMVKKTIMEKSLRCILNVKIVIG